MGLKSVGGQFGVSQKQIQDAPAGEAVITELKKGNLRIEQRESENRAKGI